MASTLSPTRPDFLFEAEARRTKKETLFCQHSSPREKKGEKEKSKLTASATCGATEKNPKKKKKKRKDCLTQQTRSSWCRVHLPSCSYHHLDNHSTHVLHNWGFCEPFLISTFSSTYSTHSDTLFSARYPSLVSAPRSLTRSSSSSDHPSAAGPVPSSFHQQQATVPSKTSLLRYRHRFSLHLTIACTASQRRQTYR